MPALRTETKVRARALQLLYAWELRERPPIDSLITGLLTLGRGRPGPADLAETWAVAVAADCDDLDREIEPAIEGWRYERVGTVEKNILRLALHELRQGETPPRVVIDEALRLAHWFAGERSPQFINGVLDHLARRLGRL